MIRRLNLDACILYVSLYPSVSCAFFFNENLHKYFTKSRFSNVQTFCRLGVLFPKFSARRRDVFAYRITVTVSRHVCTRRPFSSSACFRNRTTIEFFKKTSVRAFPVCPVTPFRSDDRYGFFLYFAKINEWRPPAVLK